MKKIFTMCIAIIMMMSLISCGETQVISDREATTGEAATFAGEWKANKLVGKMADSETYQTYIIKLNSDGSGSYQDKEGMWEYDKENNQIILTLTSESIGMVLDISEEDGKIILKYYEDTYYRTTEFVEKGMEAIE